MVKKTLTFNISLIFTSCENSVRFICTCMHMVKDMTFLLVYILNVHLVHYIYKGCGRKKIKEFE